jgi:hypothetical protein
MAENYRKLTWLSNDAKAEIYNMGRHFTRRIKEMGLQCDRRFTHVTKNYVLLKFHSIYGQKAAAKAIMCMKSTYSNISIHKKDAYGCYCTYSLFVDITNYIPNFKKGRPTTSQKKTK